MRRIVREEGQGLVEYALILVLVAIVVIVILSILGTTINLVFARVMAGFYGQTVEGTGREAIVLADAVVQGGGSCQVTVPAGTRIFILDNGELVKDQSVNVQIKLGGSTAGSMPVTTDSGGIAELASDHTVGPVSCGGGVTYGW